MSELFDAIAKRMPLDQSVDNSRGRNRLNARVDLDNANGASNANGCAC